MVIAQAMAAGKPVVATRVGGVEDMVGEDSCRGLLVNVGDVNGLAAAITRLLQDPVMQAEIGRNARLFAQENYDIERVARRTADVYHRIAAKEQKTVD
jgi:glycosyltransferase involved in cell wall biosynthesis